MSSHVLVHAGAKLCEFAAKNPQTVITTVAVTAPVVVPAAIAVGIISWLKK